MRRSRQPETPVATFLVERYWPDVTVGSFEEAHRELVASVEALQEEGVTIRTVAATLVPPDEAAYWIVDGPSADVIALAFERAGITVDRTVEALELRPEGRAPAVPAGMGGQDVDHSAR